MTNKKSVAKKHTAVPVNASPPTATPLQAKAARQGKISKSQEAKLPTTVPKAAGQQDAHDARPRHKLVRDSFTIPKSEYSVLEALKLRAAKLGRPSKKSEILRAGVAALHVMDDTALLMTLGLVPSIKTGRPKKVQPTKAETK